MVGFEPQSSKICAKRAVARAKRAVERYWAAMVFVASSTSSSVPSTSRYAMKML
jgi:hypothetical protein